MKYAPRAYLTEEQVATLTVGARVRYWVTGHSKRQPGDEATVRAVRRHPVNAARHTEVRVEFDRDPQHADWWFVWCFEPADAPPSDHERALAAAFGL